MLVSDSVCRVGAAARREAAGYPGRSTQPSGCRGRSGGWRATRRWSRRSSTTSARPRRPTCASSPPCYSARRSPPTGPSFPWTPRRPSSKPSSTQARSTTGPLLTTFPPTPSYSFPYVCLRILPLSIHSSCSFVPPKGRLIVC